MSSPALVVEEFRQVRFAPPRRRFPVDGTALAIAAITLLLYIPGMWWGLPHVVHPQVPHGWEIDTASGLAVLSELHNLFLQPQPGWYVAYPVFHYLVLGGAYTPYLAFLWLSGGLANPSGVYPYGFSDPVRSIAILGLLARFVTLAMVTGIVVCCYRTGRIVWDRATGVMAAAGVLLCVPLVYYGRTGNLDTPVLFWTVLGMVVLARSVKNGLTVKRGLTLGALAAISVATKDQAYAAWLGGFAALGVLHWRTPGRQPGFLKPLAVIAGSGFVVYAMASGLAWNPARFWAHVSFLANFETTFFNVAQLGLLRPVTPGGYAQLAIDICGCLMEAMGPVLVTAALVGLPLTWRGAPFVRILAAMTISHLVLTVFPVRHMQYRYILFAAVALMLPAARVLRLGWLRDGRTRLAAVMAGLAGACWLAVMSGDLVYQMLYDARYPAGAWLETAVRPGDRVAFFTSPDFVPNLPRGVEPVRLHRDTVRPDPGFFEEQRIAWVLVSPDNSSRSTGAQAGFRDWGMERSAFLPQAVYAGLQNGSLGYDKAADFKTRSLIGRPVKFLPWINPRVQIFVRKSKRSEG
ncbi:MAG: hypothetical protein LC130_27985 [Bryobacterales bacterium]|nr:hypothetical protein [Bryobacterales bacterium]